MSKLSKKAFAIMAMCEKTREPFGITIDPRKRGEYAAVWAFKIKKGQAKREGYDKTHVKGAVVTDVNFNGCPYCGTKDFVSCDCGCVACYHGQKTFICPNCGASGIVVNATNINLSGGDF